MPSSEVEYTCLECKHTFIPLYIPITEQDEACPACYTLDTTTTEEFWEMKDHWYKETLKNAKEEW